MKRIYFLSILILNISIAFGQTTKQELYDTPEKTGGVYYAYPYQDIVAQTPTPKGYEAFYISHLGRHGSRYLISDNDYKWILDLFEDASSKKALTKLGEDVYSRLAQGWIEAEGEGGALSPLGVRQQKGIAERMYQSFPKVFAGKSPVSARSTTVVRCVLSMDAFCERLKELNPNIQMARQANDKSTHVLNHHTKEAIAFRSAEYTWKEEHRKFEEARVNPNRLVNSLFSDKEYIKTRVNPKNLMWGLYWIASDTQNMESDISFYDVFEKEELFNLWESKNFKLYVNDGNSAWSKGIMFENTKPLLKDILEYANDAISGKKSGATLRFAHDGNVIPMASLLHLENCYNSVSESSEFYKAWSDFKVVPMAANIQIVFFKNKSMDDIIVKFMLNEKEVKVPPIKSDILPYYHWSDVETFYKSLLTN